MTLITSRSNPKVKQVKALRRRKTRRATDLILVEGIRHVGEAVEAAAAETRGDLHTGVSVQSIFYAPELLRSKFAQNLVEEQVAHGTPCYALAQDVFDSLAEKENPQGILAVVGRREQKLAELNPQNFPWGVALDAPQDPGNLGTILRSIDATGASGLILLDSHVDPYHPSAVRASMGTVFWYPIVNASFQEFASWSRAHGYHVYGTSSHGASDYQEIDRYAQPRILLMGSEREGLTPEQAALCERLVRLPMRGRATSLNLGVATGVLLYMMLARD
jgi:TrmH family RNA methyltransferase